MLFLRGLAFSSLQKVKQNAPIFQKIWIEALLLLVQYLYIIAFFEKSQYFASSIEPGKLSTNIGVHYAETTSLSSPVNGDDLSLANNGAKITLNLKRKSKAMITVVVGAKSTSDFEFKPIIFDNGVILKKLSLSASVGNANHRRVQRTVQGAFELNPGAHTISAGIQLISATDGQIEAGDAWVSVIVLN